MAENLLFLVQTAAAELGLAVPTNVVGNPDATTQQLLAHLNKIGRDLVRQHEWSALTVEPYVITTVANQELYPFPAGFDRMIGDTAWDRSMQWRLLGPDSPQLARWRRESNVSVASPRRISRQEGQSLSLYPIDTAGGALVVFDYVSRYWATTTLLLPNSYTIGVNDTDTCVYDTNLMVKGIKWSFMASKGMGSASALNLEFGAELKRAIAADLGGGMVLNMVPATRGGREDDADVIAGTQPNVILQSGGAPLLID